MALPDYSAVQEAGSEDQLRWFQISVGDRRAVGGVGGRDGPPVVFLHGWALGSHAYKRALSRLIARGCQVFAPALPGFGGTADLPAAEFHLEGYARWVASFMAAVGIEESAVVIGHSFGGGVAIKLAEQRPDLVSYLVLLNAIGGVSPRPAWEWVAGVGRELWPPTLPIDLARAVRSDLLPNLVRNPCGLVRVAQLASQADLRPDAEKVRGAGLGVLVLTGRSDGVIPREAFETLCDAIGTDGRVVEGGHSWMLADPDSFATAMSYVVDDQVARHRSARAAARAADLVELLRESRIPQPALEAFVADASPLWLLSESAPVLAADLSLCDLPLSSHEVRAIARPVQGSGRTRITIAATDRKGLLADSAAVLASSGLSITHASATTWTTRKLALHAFVVEAQRSLDAAAWDELGRKLQVMAATRSLPQVAPVRPSRVTVLGGDRTQMLVTITVRDEIGALSGLCRTFSNHGINIESLHARSSGGKAHDTFLVSGVGEHVSVADLFLDKVRDTSPGGAASGPQRARGAVRRDAPRASHLFSVP